MSGIKHDSGKAELHLIPYDALAEIAKVLMFGKEKYGEYNFMNGMDWHRLYDASLRHKGQWFWKETIDAESGLSHMAHAACNDIMLLTYELNQLGNDNRYHTIRSKK